MTKAEIHTRIVATPETMFGKPRIDGTRITVEHVLRRLALGWSFDEIIDQHPRVTKEDIQAAIEFAADKVGNTNKRAVDAAE
jgi:uncharacterized protein (DUF433 family)